MDEALLQAIAFDLTRSKLLALFGIRSAVVGMSDVVEASLKDLVQ
jgi:hypothetical protein